jgi:GWxTD domain-containing protein
LTAVLAFAAFSNAATPDPAEALSQARQHIASERFAEAAALLESALPVADAINDAAIRTQAKAALHFYAGVAQAGLKHDDKASAHIAEYLTLAPNKRTIDASKYAPRFVKLFNKLAATDTPVENNFASVYPGYRSFTNEVVAATTVDLGLLQTVAIDILATPAEKRQFKELRTPERETFLAAFWKKRDTTPETPENEAQQAFNRRVVFAEKNFGTREATGAYDDRGRVFILLGEPVFVVRRPITGYDSVQLPDQIQRGTMVNGTIEQWVYNKEQLAITIAKPSISFRFVSQPGIGENVLQRQEDAYAMQALASAGNTAPGIRR